MEASLFKVNKKMKPCEKKAHVTQLIKDLSKHSEVPVKFDAYILLASLVLNIEYHDLDEKNEELSAYNSGFVYYNDAVAGTFEYENASFIWADMSKSKLIGFILGQMTYTARVKRLTKNGSNPPGGASLIG